MLEKEITEILKQLHAGTAKIAPDAMAAVARAVFWIHIVPLVGSTLSLLVTGICTLKAYRFVTTKLDQLLEEDEGKGEICGVTCLVVLVLTFISLIWFMDVAFDARTWMGIFDPKAYIAHEVLQRLGGG